MMNLKKYMICLIIIGGSCNAQYGKHEVKAIHFVLEHGDWTQEEWDQHTPFAHYKSVFVNHDDTVGILNKWIKTATSHHSDLFRARIWDIQYHNGKWSRAVAKNGKDRRKIRKRIKELKRKHNPLTK